MKGCCYKKRYCLYLTSVGIVGDIFQYSMHPKDYWPDVSLMKYPPSLMNIVTIDVDKAVNQTYFKDKQLEWIEKNVKCPIIKTFLEVRVGGN